MAVRPTDSIEVDEGICQRRLQLVGERSKLPTAELEPVHIGRSRVGDAQLGWRCPRHRNVLERVADHVHAKTKFIDQPVVEGVRLRNTAEASTQRDIKREVQVGGIRGIAGLHLQVIGAEGLVCLRIGPEKPPGQLVLTAVKVLVPVGGELIVCVPAGIGENQGPVIWRRSACPCV